MTAPTLNQRLRAVPASQWRDTRTGCIRTDIQSKWRAIAKAKARGEAQ